MLTYEPQKIMKHSFEKERELILRAQQGDKQALEEFLMQKYFFVMKHVLKFVPQSSSLFPDLMQTGLMTLIKLVKSFDVSKNIMFMSYAKHRLDHDIAAELFKSSVDVKINTSLIHTYYKEFLALMQDKKIDSAKKTQQSENFDQFISNEEDSWQTKIDVSLLYDLLEPEEADLIDMWANDKSFKEIGKKFHYSKQRAHQRLQQIFKKLKEATNGGE